MSSNLKKIIVVAGPTSSGKSDFAVEIALKVGGEIISADSCQIYKGLDIGTGKITQEEMKGIPHHMLNICDINDSFSVLEYQSKTLTLIDEIIQRGKVPILCGGTGYYIDAVIYSNTLSSIPVNKDTEEELEKLETEDLALLLKEKDYERYTTIDTKNRRRLIRALQIIDSVGKVPVLEKPVFRYDVDMYLLNPSKETLEKRVHRRLLKRLDGGMIEEMRSLIKQGYAIATIASRGIEYKWMAQYIKKEISYDELIEKLRIATWQYAKRQRTWNKKYEAFATVVIPSE